MLIHTVNGSDDLFSIARKYSTYPQKLLSDNYPLNEKLNEGDEILVLIPTKTESAKGGDTLRSIAIRNGIKENCLLRQNSELIRRGLRPGQTVTLRQSAPTLGAASAIGRYSPRYPISNLTEALPYLTYVTVNGAKICLNGISISAATEPTVKKCVSNGKIPLLEVMDESGGDGLLSETQRTDAINTLKDISKSHGFKGVVICAPEFAERHAEKYLDFLLELRKKFLGCDLMLFTELFDGTPTDAADISDGAILNTDIKTIGEVRNLLQKTAALTESSKIFVSVYTVIDHGGKAISFKDARGLGSGKFSAVSTDKESLISTVPVHRIENGKRVLETVSFPSLKYTEAKLRELSKLGFMGISIDLRYLDNTRLCMFNAAFRRADYELT
jgi:spore germination protein YaaH